MEEDLKYPLYRKLLNGKSVYMIPTPDVLIEYQKLGQNILLHSLKASILPERVLIADIIANEGNRWETITADEFDSWEKLYEQSHNKEQ